MFKKFEFNKITTHYDIKEIIQLVNEKMEDIGFKDIAL